MSSSSLTDTSALLGTVTRPSLRNLVIRPIKQLAFWSAIVLPFLHLSLLVNGLESESTTLAFVALLAVNVLAIYIGQPSGGN
jgi:hypothetical protein